MYLPKNKQAKKRKMPLGSRSNHPPAPKSLRTLTTSFATILQGNQEAAALYLEVNSNGHFERTGHFIPLSPTILSWVFLQPAK